MIASNASTDTTPIISVRGLVNQFGEQVVHGGLDLEVMPGEILGVVGGSGTGKSVLMRSIVAPYAVPGLEFDRGYGTLLLGASTRVFGLDADIGLSTTVGQNGGSNATAFASISGSF